MYFFLFYSFTFKSVFIQWLIFSLFKKKFLDCVFSHVYTHTEYTPPHGHKYKTWKVIKRRTRGYSRTFSCLVNVFKACSLSPDKKTQFNFSLLSVYNINGMNIIINHPHHNSLLHWKTVSLAVVLSTLLCFYIIIATSYLADPKFQFTVLLVGLLV